MSVETIGAALSALTALATALIAFFSRRSDQLRKDFRDVCAERDQLRRDLRAADQQLYRYRRALDQNGIPVPGEDPGYDPRAARRARSPARAWGPAPPGRHGAP